LDRKKQRKEKDWDSLHKTHIYKFGLRVKEAKEGKGTQFREHNQDAFNNYLRYFLANSRVTILEPAYPEDILEQPLAFDEVGTLEYNRLVREGRQTSFAPVVNFVRNEIQKQANECEYAFESYPRGDKGESAFRKFVKVCS
jgi:hypothetical protein